MTTHDVHHLAAAYALDALDADERREFEAHYPACSICVDEVGSFRVVAGQLAEGAQAPPPDDLKERVMGEILQTRQLSPLVPDAVVDLTERRATRSRRVAVVAVAAGIIAMAGIASVFAFGNRMSDTERILAAPDAVVTALDGANGSVSVVWSDELDQVVIFGNGMPDTGDRSEFALWFVQADGVAPAGLFDSTDGEVRTVLDVEDVDVSGWGVTIEPNGGSDQPTSDILFVATF